MNNTQKLYHAIANALTVEIELINEETNSDNIDGWDSVGMVRLMIELEKQFGIKFDVVEIVDFQSVNIIKKKLEKKLIKFN
tara:strand:- start:261 stop:503 length:243 start_codon:yes stop_codon:yes gene_type:complete